MDSTRSLDLTEEFAAIVPTKEAIVLVGADLGLYDGSQEYAAKCGNSDGESSWTSDGWSVKNGLDGTVARLLTSPTT
jgi:hypothetical protein